jgi:uncharacterized phage-associated protein
MATVHDVAAFILAEMGQVGAMQLQKLVYYAQAWSLVWDGEPLFPEQVQAWDKGPVVSELWERCARAPFVGRIAGDTSSLSVNQRATIAAVLAFYGIRSGSWLSELSHREPPWLEARLHANGSRNPVITQDAMRVFFATYHAPIRQIPDAVARGLELVVGLPKDIVADVLHEESTEVVGIEEWLETGEGNPWRVIAD